MTGREEGQGSSEIEADAGSAEEQEGLRTAHVEEDQLGCPLEQEHEDDSRLAADAIGDEAPGDSAQCVENGQEDAGGGRCEGRRLQKRHAGAGLEGIYGEQLDDAENHETGKSAADVHHPEHPKLGRAEHLTGLKVDCRLGGRLGAGGCARPSCRGPAGRRVFHPDGTEHDEHKIGNTIGDEDIGTDR